MPLNVPDRTTCFVDANILYYHFVATPPFSEPCSDFLQRVADGLIKAFVSTHVLAEAIHKIMVAEAAAKFGLNRAGLVNWLQHHRMRITELELFREACFELLAIGLREIPMDAATLRSATDIAKQMGLLTNDAIIVALMQSHHIVNLVTNDEDFIAIPGITIWQPR